MLLVPDIRNQGVYVDADVDKPPCPLGQCNAIPQSIAFSRRGGEGGTFQKRRPGEGGLFAAIVSSS
jgi:hypothetical protein